VKLKNDEFEARNMKVWKILFWT